MGFWRGLAGLVWNQGGFANGVGVDFFSFGAKQGLQLGDGLGKSWQKIEKVGANGVWE